MVSQDLRYPIGKFESPEKITREHIDNWTQTIKDFPQNLEVLVKDLSEDQLNTPYRKDGWTIRQVVHHCYDSHHNSYTRFKWALTEEAPIIKAYFEDRWAELPDTTLAPISLSLNSLKALHAKWVYLLKGLKNKELRKYFIHPESNDKIYLDENIGIYAWHCNHHYAHIEQLMIRENWK